MRSTGRPIKIQPICPRAADKVVGAGSPLKPERRLASNRRVFNPIVEAVECVGEELVEHLSVFARVKGRQVLQPGWLGVTAHPTAGMANQLTEACGWESPDGQNGAFDPDIPSDAGTMSSYSITERP
jgi:hypothetical protein